MMVLRNSLSFQEQVSRLPTKHLSPFLYWIIMHDRNGETVRSCSLGPGNKKRIRPFASRACEKTNVGTDAGCADYIYIHTSHVRRAVHSRAVTSTAFGSCKQGVRRSKAAGIRRESKIILRSTRSSEWFESDRKEVHEVQRALRTTNT